MKIKSQILKDEFDKAFRLKKKSNSDLENERKNLSKEIERNENNIKICLTRLREYHESKRKLIAKIRNIMETPSNHEKGLICNKLTKNKEEEYTREISNLNRLIKTDISKIEEYKIAQERELIRKNKSNYDNSEGISISCTDEAIENGRTEIIKLSIGFLENNTKNKQSIEFLKNKKYLEKLKEN